MSIKEITAESIDSRSLGIKYDPKIAIDAINKQTLNTPVIDFEHGEHATEHCPRCRRCEK